MKKLTLLALTVVAFLCTGCYAARIVTTSPGYHVGYSTTVSYPTTNVATNIYASDYDLCLHLDLQAVGAAFAQSATVRDFEILLNNSSYMISNLDLNRDGYVDYLRVVETLDRFTHVFVVQAVLGNCQIRPAAQFSEGTSIRMSAPSWSRTLQSQDAM